MKNIRIFSLKNFFFFFFFVVKFSVFLNRHVFKMEVRKMFVWMSINYEIPSVF